MKCLIDAQLPPALARFLTANGEDAVHVLDVEMMESSDSEIWDFAMREEMVIITKDEDFQVRASVTQHHPVIIWVRIGNCSKKTLPRLSLQHALRYPLRYSSAVPVLCRMAADGRSLRY